MKSLNNEDDKDTTGHNFSTKKKFQELELGYF